MTIIPGDRYLTSSSTSLSISNGAKTLTVGTGLSYTATQDITIAYDASNHMHAQVVSYNSGSGLMSVDVKSHTGSGTYSAWIVNVGGVTPVPTVAWGNITGTISTQTDLQSALDSKYDASNPAGYVTAATAPVTSVAGKTGAVTLTNADISGLGTMATQSASNYAALAGATFTGDVSIDSSSSLSYRVSRTVSPTLTYTSTLGHSLMRVGFVDFSNAFGYLSATEMRVGNSGGATPTGYISAYTNTSGAFNPFITLVELGPAAPIQGRSTTIKEGKFLVNNNDGNPEFEPYVSSSALAAYAPLAGAAFTGPVTNAASTISARRLIGQPNAGVAGVNIGTGGTDAGSTTPGDIWIATGGASLNFRDGQGSWRQCLTTSSAGIIDINSTSTALRVTQRGTGESFRVEDSTTPDATAFVISNSGRVGVGIAPDATAAICVDSSGIKFGANAVVQSVEAVVTSTGTYDKEIPVTINGVNYRIPCRQV